MKKTASVGLLFVLALTAVFPVFSQRARRVVAKPPAVEGEFARFGSVAAYSSGNGVSLHWRMAEETGNVGFQVYRLGNAGYELVNATAMIPGAIVESRTTTAYDRDYETFDAQGTLGSSYIIESLSLDGRTIRTNIFGVTLATATAEGDPILYATPVESNGDIQNGAPKAGAELQGIIDANRLDPDPDVQRWVAGQPGAKIVVRQEGFYRVSRLELANAGFNVNSPSENWRLFVEGNEQAIIVGGGDQFIEFYGKAIDTPESDGRIYYLIADTNPGRRVQTKIIRAIGGNVVSNSSRVLFEKKERTNYDGRTKNGDLENYWGRVISGTPPLPTQQIKFDLSDIDPSVSYCFVTIRLQGVQLPGTNHSVRAVLNGTEIGFVTGTGSTSYEAEFFVNSSVLVNGENSLALNEATSGVFSLFDRVRVDYARRYISVEDNVAYAAPGYRRINATGFSTPNVRVFETTYDGSPFLISGHTVQPEGSTFTVRVPSARPMLMNILADTAFLSSPSVTANVPSTLYAATNRADMIIISHSAPDVLAVAQSWANYREGSAGGGLETIVVDVADVFDEFNYGASSADSINAFLRRAFESWQTPRPQYVLLLGDASYDARNYEGFGYFNQVPTKILNLIYDESGSDDALADFNGDGLPEMAVGRIASRTAFGVTTALNKTIRVEAEGPASFNRGGVFAYDVPNGYDFHAMTLQLVNQLPGNFPVTLISRGLPPPNQNTPDPNAQANLMAALNLGPLMVNYNGHGSAGTWASSGFFSSANIPQLTNVDRYSVYTTLSCLNSYFLRPRDQESCLSERLMNHAGGGAVATWSSTTETTPDFQLVMGTRFYNRFGQGTIPRLGDLIRDAKSVLPGNSDVRYSWVLLGDPALKVR